MWANFCLSITNKIDGEIVRNYLVVDKKLFAQESEGQNNKFQLAKAWLILKFQKEQKWKKEVRRASGEEKRRKKYKRKMSVSELKVKLTEN